MDRAHISERKSTGLIKSVLISWVFTVIFGAALLVGAALILSRAKDPSPLIRICGIALPALTALGGGVFAGKADKRVGALAGTLCGSGFIGLLFILSKLIGEGSFSAWQTILFYAVLILLAALGGILGSTHRESKKRRHRKRR